MKIYDIVNILEEITLDSGNRVVKNPTTTGLVNLLMRSKNKSLRGLIHGQNVYWWDANDAIHGEVAKEIGYQDYIDHRLHLALDPRYDEIRVEIPDRWTDSEILSHPQLKKLSTDDRFLFYGGSAGWITGRELLHQMAEQLTEYRSQEIAHKNPSISMLKALAKNNRYHSARFVIYRDGTVVAADSENFTHNSMAPAMNAWDVKGYIQYLGGNDYAYRSMEPYSAINKYHPILKNWERSGIQDGNSDQSHLNQKLDEKQSDWEIHNYHKLDKILLQLCRMVVKHHSDDPDRRGMVGAAVLDPKNRIVTGMSTKINDLWHHAERCAIHNYQQQFGTVPDGSILITTCSPCSERMGDRFDVSCTDLINNSNIHKVYTGYDDPTQPEEQRHFNIIETRNPVIRNFCHRLAETFMNWEEEQATDALAETWSKKYKRSINCHHPRGFSQRAHCAARKKRQSGGKTTSKPIS